VVKARSTFLVLLLFLWTAAPALSCVLQSKSLTPDEQACCKEMGGNCGEMANHSCCKKVESRLQPALAAATANAPEFAAIAMLPVVTVDPSQSLLSTDVAIAPSPPRQPISTAILRI
jgi:hypothetical protein